MGLNIPISMKRRHGFWDRFWSLEGFLWVSTAFFGIAWIIGKAFPQSGWFQHFVHPMPSPVGDMGLFNALHIAAGVWCYHLHRDAKRWKNPALITRSHRFSLDRNFGQKRFGDLVMCAGDAFDTDKAGQTDAECYVTFDYWMMDPLDKDVFANGRCLPVPMNSLPPVAFQYLSTIGGISENTLFWRVFPEELFLEDGTPHPEVLRTISRDRGANTLWSMDQTNAEAVVESFQSLNDITRSLRKTARDRAPSEHAPPKPIEQLRRNEED